MGHRKGGALQVWPAFSAQGGHARQPIDACSRQHRPHQAHQRRLHFPANHRIHTMREQIVPIEPGVQPEETNMRVRVGGPHPPRRLHAKSESRLHRRGNAYKRSRPRRRSVEWLHSQVERRGLDAGLPQRGQGPGKLQGLVTQLIARNQQNWGGRQ